ncbi:hypothetical protein E2562_039339 [Oryza meyeriana var. granulata]|uniref:Retrotransposon gag domain-containing protein n=1 Tax=Oryza meyeriana var. granulata TaxID=110450 RepID=A0A6G1EUJ6_9ORYZ|nr:hypothetical protein E2562_039339 [Oryza meyeriana var. granulata]
MVANTKILGAALAPNANQRQSKLADVQRTRQPTFSSTTNPLDADDWLHDIEAKLILTCCDEMEKAAYAVHYLPSTAAAWWESYKTLNPPDKLITWTVFNEGFQSAHILAGLMEITRREFLALKQGSQTFMEFLNRFNYVSQYATEEMPTKARKVKLC